MGTTMIRFEFDERCAAQAAAHLLDAIGGEMPYLKLIKLMYLAERRSLADDGYSITGDRIVSMPKGPVLSRTLDLIKAHDHAAGAEWPKYVTAPEDYSVRSTGEGCRDGLSDYDCDLLEEVAKEFGHLTEWELVEHTHDLPEWRDPAGSSAEINPAEIMRIAGHSEDEIAAVAEQLDVERAFKRKMREWTAQYGE